MTNLLLFVALATIIGLTIILAKTFKEKNVLKEDLKDSHDKIIKHVKELNDENRNLKKQIEVLQSELGRLSKKHTEYLQTMQDLTDENNRLKQHIEQLTASIQVNKIETKSKKNRRV